MRPISAASVANGVPIEFASLLFVLGQASTQLADTLASDAARIAGQSGTSPVDVWGLTSYVFPELRIGSAAFDGSAPTNLDLRRQTLEAAYVVLGRYVAALQDHALAKRPDPDAAVDPSSVFEGQGLTMSYLLARQLTPMFDAYDPERATAYRVLVGQIEGAAPTDLRDRVGAAVATNETPEAVASRADAATDRGVRTTLYVRAAYLALARDGYDSAKSYVSRIEDDDERARALGQLAKQAALTAVQNRQFDEARRIAADVSDLDERARVFSDLARALVVAGKRQQALDSLDDAQRNLIKDGAVATSSKAEALVRIANTYAGLDAVRGFDVMRTAVDMINKGVVFVDDSSDGQPKRNPALLYRIGEFDASQGLEELARTDYFRSLMLAQSIDNRALSILAQIGAVRGAMRPLEPQTPDPAAAPVRSDRKPKKAEPTAVAPSPAATETKTSVPAEPAPR